ncbi:hypothetical protein U9M48_039164 [Paspalum notatum var. saurae]|uniref:DRBM domain-containing protein n=1 Tax=Paspalum notatum var. saurae TaxID=547442 RepID=A0AAQ3XCE5_PASNO
MATATATSTAATTAATADPSPPNPEKNMHKNRLQSYAARTHKMLPVYSVECEGEYHQPKFRCTVEVGGQQFSSTGSFSRKKEAEQDAARVAYEILVTVGENDVKEMLGMIDQDGVFSKSILYEFAVKTKTTWPAYSVVRLEKPFTMFVASVVFDGTTYTGDSAPNMKDAKQNAARSVIKSILATGNTCMVEIIRSKKHLITAVRSSGNTSTTFTPIKFTRSVAYTAYGGPDHVEPMSQDGSSSLAVQGHSIAPTVGPSAKPSTKVVTVSKKRKDRIEGPDVNEARVAKEH